MNRKELLDKIKNEMPKDLDEEEQAAYIMMEIARNRSFSEHYYWGDSKTERKMYHKATDPENIEEQDKRKLICVTASRLFHYIASQMGHDVYYISEDGIPAQKGLKWLRTGEHVYPAVKLSNGEIIKCDVQRDLENIQTGCRWKHFGTCDYFESGFLSKKSEERREQIMRKIGYIKEGQIYTDDFCKEQHLKQAPDTTVTEAVASAFNEKQVSEKLKDSSIVEAYKFYRKVIENYLGGRGNMEYVTISLQLVTFENKFFMFPCRLRKNDEDRYTICSYTYEDGEITSLYLLSRTTKQMTSITLEELSYYQQLGLKMPVAGIKALRKGLRQIKCDEEIQPIDIEEFLEENLDEERECDL